MNIAPASMLSRGLTRLNHPHDGIANRGEFSGLQFTDLTGNQTAVRGERLSGTRIAGQPKRAVREVASVERYGFDVAVGLAGIWRRIQSPRPAYASTTAGHSLDAARSEKENERLRLGRL